MTGYRRTTRRSERLGTRRIGVVLSLIAVLLGTALLETSVSATGASILGGRCGRSVTREEYRIRTFHVEYELDKKLYAIGETVKVSVNVTTPAEEDPLGEGIPLPIDRPLTRPVEGATVGVGIHLGRVYLPGASMTDADGNATVLIKLEDYAPRNTWADVRIYAFKTMIDIPCLKIVEYGHAIAPRAFRTAP